jgi:hypothetical protein
MKLRNSSGRLVITVPSWLVQSLDLAEGDDFSFHVKENNRNMIVLLKEKLE